MRTARWQDGWIAKRNMTKSSFERLIIWQKGMSIARDVYELTLKLPTEERYGLVTQMRRAAISIPSNIAEGQKRSTKKDFAQFLRISAGSAAELETQLILASSIHNLQGTEIIRSSVQTIQRMITSMIKKLR